LLRLHGSGLGEIFLIVRFRTVGLQTPYYALQNILECIATLANPNAFGATQLINDSSRSTIFSIEPKADGWLRGLGQSRIDALHTHGTIVIPDDEACTHLGNLQLLHWVLLNPSLAKTAVGKELEDRFGISVPTGTPPVVDQLHL